jgi:hypothetical protein
MRLNFYSNFVQLIYELNSSEVYMNRAQAVNEQIDSFTILLAFILLSFSSIIKAWGWWILAENVEKLGILLREIIHIHFLHIFIQSNFKFTIEFVRPNTGLINSILNLKMKCIKNV